MKKLLLTLTIVTASALTMYGQGRVFFNNITSGGAVTVDPLNQGAPGGNAGDFCGGDKYSIQLLFAPGSFANQAAFDAAVPTASAVFNAAFFDVTGPSAANGAGFFDAGTVAGFGAAGTYTLQARAWFNTGFATYDAAVAGAKNVGRSALFTMTVTASPTPVNTTLTPGFTVGVVPEPSTFALAGLGAAALLLFRRRK